SWRGPGRPRPRRAPLPASRWPRPRCRRRSGVRRASRERARASSTHPTNAWRCASITSELCEKARVVFEEESKVVDPVAQHGDALDAHPEGEAGDGVRIVAGMPEDLRVDHAGAEDLQPARALADAADGSVRGRDGGG